jgi:uncharacterized protein YndB with AHSA1/START domain
MTRVALQAEVDIRRSPNDVFDFCSDLSHEPEWNPMMKHVVKLTDGPVGIGTRYTTEFVDAPPMVMECIHYERSSAWSITGDSRALKAPGGGRVLPTSEGAHLVMRMELEPHGLLKLATPLLRRRMKWMFQRDLDNIKRPSSRERSGPHPMPHGGPRLPQSSSCTPLPGSRSNPAWCTCSGQASEGSPIAAQRPLLEWSLPRV